MADIVFLSRDQILASESRTYQPVPVPEWGGVVRLQSLTGTERDAFQSEMVLMGTDGPEFQGENATARLLALCIVDGAGNRLFSPRDVAALGAKNAKALGRVYNAAARLNGLDARDLRKASDDLEKNLNGEPGIDSPRISEFPSQKSKGG